MVTTASTSGCTPLERALHEKPALRELFDELRRCDTNVLNLASEHLAHPARAAARYGGTAEYAETIKCRPNARRTEARTGKNAQLPAC